MLEIKNLHATVGGKEILRGINLTIRDGEIHAVMGTNGAGKSTLCNVIVGHPAYTVTEGSITLDGQDLLAMSIEERAHAGVFMSFQHPIEIPGVSMVNFMRTAVNARRQALGLEPLKSTDFLKLMREKRALVDIDNRLVNRSVNEGFSGGEKKRNEIFQMAMLDPSFCILDETDSGLDVDALRVVAEGFNKIRTEQTSAIVITHYQRLLDYIKPDVVHVLLNGQLVKTGGPELAQQIEKQGFDWIKEELNA
jgi:Fe-S cluster assembly ATP-binding protein